MATGNIQRREIWQNLDTWLWICEWTDIHTYSHGDCNTLQPSWGKLTITITISIIIKIIIITLYTPLRHNITFKSLL